METKIVMLEAPPFFERLLRETNRFEEEEKEEKAVCLAWCPRQAKGMLLLLLRLLLLLVWCHALVETHP